jgi:hypothetical protein
MMKHAMVEQEYQMSGRGKSVWGYRAIREGQNLAIIEQGQKFNDNFQ